MNKLITIGEALIDFIPNKVDDLKNVESFKRVAGGAPANVAACVASLGKESILLTKLGKDAFGDHIIEVLSSINVNVNYIKRTSEANTGLAFVSLNEDGNREFVFYRKPSSDLLFSETEIDESIFNPNDILHFCSVDLVESPMKKAHLKAIKTAIDKNSIVCFDPNLRYSLWESKEELINVVNEFIPYAHILKLSDEELFDITSIEDSELAIKSLFRGNVKIVIYTLGKDGALVYTKDNMFSHDGFIVKAIDTTGCGDGFIGAVIYKMLGTDLNEIEYLDYKEIIEFGNAVGAMIALKEGVIPNMPTAESVKKFIRGRK